MSQLSVSLSPHAKAPFSVSTIMWMVNLSLIPALAVSTWVFGFRALLITALSVGTAVVTEALIQRSMKQELTVRDGSAVITGLLLAFNVPVTLPWYMVVIGAAFAMGIGKWAFGGLGQNPFNPALVGRAFLSMSFTLPMTRWVVPFFENSWTLGVDTVTGPTPLAIIGENAGNLVSAWVQELPSLMDLFLGFRGGSMGEISAAALLLGGGVLMVKRIVPWQVPLATFGGLGLVTGIAWLIAPTTTISPLYHFVSGGTFLAAFYMVTDMTTSPMTIWGRVLFAFAIGVVAALIRLFSDLPEGFSYAILFMNALVPLIDKAIKPRRFGHQNIVEWNHGN
jgi:electron transport complex protein RnfD